MHEVRGWMTENERLALRRLAFGRDVLEIGSFEGLSTAQLACTAKSVVAVDTFNGLGTVHHGHDTYAAFLQTMERCGTADRVEAIRGLSADVLPTLPRYSFDVVFIDGSHDYESVRADVALSLPLLRTDGLLAFHDYTDQHPGVYRTVNELLGVGMHAREQAGSLVVLSTEPPPDPKPVCVALALPHRDCWVHLGSALGATQLATTRGVPLVFLNRGNSVLTYCFNSLLADALNARVPDGVTHFAMLHNDVIPDASWLDTLLAEMRATGCDLVSAVVPLKNSKGLTSTGLDTPGDPWSVRRFTMAEIYGLPETFAADDVPWRQGEQQLLVNSGCWLMKLDQPWVEGLCFRQQDRLAFDTVKKEYVAQSISEDWDWSRQVATRGGRIVATRKVGITHERPEFHNRGVWGAWERDEAFEMYLGELAAAQ